MEGSSLSLSKEAQKKTKTQHQTQGTRHKTQGGRANTKASTKKASTKRQAIKGGEKGQSRKAKEKRGQHQKEERGGRKKQEIVQLVEYLCWVEKVASSNPAFLKKGKGTTKSKGPKGQRKLKN